MCDNHNIYDLAQLLDENFLTNARNGIVTTLPDIEPVSKPVTHEDMQKVIDSFSRPYRRDRW